MTSFSLNSIKLTNWISYYGVKEFNFSQKRGNNSYIIFGEDSRGKTAFFESFHYAFFGQVIKRQKGGTDDVIHKPAFSDKKKDEPLMNVDAYKEYRQKGLTEKCKFSVRFEFDWNGSSYTLHRGAQAKGSRFVPEEFVDLIPDGGGALKERDRAEILHKILPKQLKEFFLVDGEYMEKYRDLIASSDTTRKDEIIRNQIEQIIGLPVLKDAKDFDFPEIKSKVNKKHKELAKVNQNAESAYSNLESIRSEMKGIVENLELTRMDLEKQRAIRDELWDWIMEHKSDSQLAEEYAGNKTKIKNLTKARNGILEERRKALSKDENGTWLSILQPHLLDLMKAARKATEEISDIKNKRSRLEGRLEEKYDLLKSANKICSACLQPVSLSEDARKSIEDETLEMERTIEGYRNDIERISNGKGSINSDWAITRFGDGGNLAAVVKIEGELKENTRALSKLNGRQRKLNRDINEGAVSEFNKKKLAHDNAETACTMILSAIEEYNDELEKLKKEETAAEFAADLGDSEQGFKISQKLKYLNFLQRIWDGAIDGYESIKRKETERIASRSFIRMTNNPQGFKGLELGDGFGLKIIDSDGDEHPGSPGAWSVVAISMIHALSECSSISFPLVIDTPLRSIGKGHFEEVSEFLFNSDRTVLLLPNYLVNMDETEKRLEKTLSASWDVGWGDAKYPQFDGCEINKTHVLKRVGG